MEKIPKRKHFVLIHGVCHGAWCWYKLIPLLEKAGHRATAVDMAASGINMKSIHELKGIRDYTEPLLKFLEELPQDEKVVLVGHSYGGVNVALATEIFPEKIEVEIYVAAIMSSTAHQPSYVVDKFLETEEGFLDSEFKCDGDPAESLTTVIFGPKCMALQLYCLQLRPSSVFQHELPKGITLSEKGYGSVRRVYVTCDQDRTITLNFQHWMIEESGASEVKELKGSDHMPMFCMPQELCNYLVDIAFRY
ncbi:Salicylic acid-binding protein 2-like protein [Drosera capensis]